MMEENKVYDEDEKEISIRLMLYNGLKNWRLLLLAGIVFGLLFAGGKAVKGYRSTGTDQTDLEEIVSTVSSSSAEVTRDKHQDHLQDENQQYKVSKASLDYSIQSLLDTTEKNAEYKAYSILMNLNPYNLKKNTLIYYIQTENGSNNSTVVIPDSNGNTEESYSGVANAYLALLEADTMKNYTGEDKDLDTRYLKELILADVDQTGSVLTIKVVGDSEKLVNDLTDYVKENMNSWQEKVTEAAGEHRIQLLMENTNGSTDTADEASSQIVTPSGTVQVCSDVSVASLQDAFNSSMSSIQSQLDNLRKMQNNLQEPTTDEVAAGGSLKKNVVKYGVIGFAVGFFLLLLWYCLSYALSGKLKTEDDIQKFLGVEKLAVYRHPLKHKARFDVFLRKHMGFTEGVEDRAEAIRTAAAAIDLKTGLNADPMSKVLLVSSLGQESAQSFVEELTPLLKDISVEFCPDALHSADIYLRLNDVKQVVVLEEAGQTRTEDMESEVRRVRSNGGQILGAVIL
ncbi:hypothetical protein [Bilifractor porci]|uniref:Capsular polysaccharide biosynthesis protein n=1 Tax=Bilifractor porci TaxID=2606636 RepID=A0A7X2PA03_9FIRM|nr:hypothetical protein [Bilifractor porci]MST82536.1 hypothetical protein [Bilifractor porci]